jgi:hypothetical protein
MRYLIFIALIVKANASDLPSSDVISGDQVISTFNTESSNKQIPEDQVLGNIQQRNIEKKLDEMGIKDPGLRKNILKSNNFLKNMGVRPDSSQAKEDKIKVSASAPKRNKQKIIKRKIKRVKKSSIQIYPMAPEIVQAEAETITLPSASLAPATLMAGIEVAAEKRQVDVKLDYAFVGPNGSVVDLSNCHTWVDVYGNYNTERIYGETSSISCRAPNGKTFEIAIQGQLRDEKDEYIGVKAELLMRGKAKAMGMEFLQGAIKGYGEATAAAQVTTEVVSGTVNTNPTSGQNITGNQDKYITGQAVASAAGNFLDWYIDFYKSLAPTLATPPGKKVYLSIKGEIQIPKVFFKDAKLNTNSTLTVMKEDKQ